MNDKLTSVVNELMVEKAAQSIRVKLVVGESLAYDNTSVRGRFKRKVFDAVGQRETGSSDKPTDTGSVVEFIPLFDNKNQKRIMSALGGAFTEADGYKVTYDGEEKPDNASYEVKIPTYSVTAIRSLNQ